MTAAIQVHNAQAVSIHDVPVLSVREFRDCIIAETAGEAHVASLFGRPAPGGRITLTAVLARPRSGDLAIVSTEVTGSYPALTPDCPQTHWFEREIAEQWSVRSEGHPWLKPIRFHAPYRTAPSPLQGEGRGEGDSRDDRARARPAIGVTDFFRVQGPEIHEVAVGPVHAGVIEPGHFRFQCHGEDVLHLEISLGYQHRGVERAILERPARRRLHYMETLAGDTTIGHATAYCQAIESLSGARIPARAHALRGIALELERLANHAGDLGALAGDVGFLPTASHCGRLRGEFLNMTAAVCGSRFGRGLVRPGGVGFDVDQTLSTRLLTSLEHSMRDVAETTELLFATPSVLARFEETGTISREVCRELGLVGPAARACGVSRDVRFDFPTGIFSFVQIPVSTWQSGDVFARAHVRRLEIQRSAAFVREQLQSLPAGARIADPPSTSALDPSRMVVSLVEGWRGEICHVAITDPAGQLGFYKVVDPSFHNWMGLAMALRNQQISDFPLCNKSFNLSYCGHDL